MRRSYPESDLHKAVAQYLNLVLTKETWWTSIAHGEGGGFVRGAKWKAKGAKAGVPDILIVHDGRAHFVELKSDIGRLSTKQIDTHFALGAAGANVATCRSVNAVAETLSLWGIETREARLAA